MAYGIGEVMQRESCESWGVSVYERVPETCQACLLRLFCNN